MSMISEKKPDSAKQDDKELVFPKNSLYFKWTLA